MPPPTPPKTLRPLLLLPILASLLFALNSNSTSSWANSTSTFSYLSSLLPYSPFTPSQTAVALETCPDLYEFSKTVPEGRRRSEGVLGLPSMRPRVECRTFSSPAVEDLVDDFAGRMKDPDLAMLFENALTSTLDTTIKWSNEGLTFVVTGDITAMWIRDSCNQLAIYQSLAPKDPNLATLIRGAIALQAQYLGEYPYCGAFQPPSVSGLAPTINDWSQGVSHPFKLDNQTVFECKYELDSIGGFLKLSRQFYEATGDTSYLTPAYLSTIDTVFELIQNQTESTLSPSGHLRNSYAFHLSQPKIPIPNQGLGHPAKETGLVKTSFRPSDDPVIFPYNIPVNALLVVELKGLAKVLEEHNLRPDLVKKARGVAARVEKAIWEWGVEERKGWGTVFAYEVDGFGGRVFMDDANVPSLLSLPYLGFLDASDPVYQNTRKMLMNQDGNPYFSKGEAFFGIGGPHEEGLLHPWPMSLVSFIITSTSDDEIMSHLEWIKNSTTGLGLIHESINIHSVENYTRPWFSWANSYFAETVLKVAKERPWLLFKE
ncbi:Six-hairpin glycosidase-like protein [Mrakia frigida]|uniref:glycoside hydrolase family 125 protein n=1 Tax=Mrakia frigida TaxID=29902 RepID=UPI003FCC162D